MGTCLQETRSTLLPQEVSASIFTPPTAGTFLMAEEDAGSGWVAPRTQQRFSLGKAGVGVPRAGAPNFAAQLPPPSKVTVAVHFVWERGLHSQVASRIAPRLPYLPHQRKWPGPRKLHGMEDSMASGRPPPCPSHTSWPDLVLSVDAIGARRINGQKK